MTDPVDDPQASLRAALAAVTARLHAEEGHGPMAEYAAVERALRDEVGDDLISGLSALAVGLAQAAAVALGLPAEDLLRRVALGLSQQGGQ